MGVTISDIAKELGVSIATVSHALNKTKYVNPELEKRIQQTAKAKGYVSKHEAKGLKYRMGKASEIALIVPNTYSIVYSYYITVLTEYVDRAGYTLLIYLSEGNQEKEIHIIEEIISNKRTAGVIMAPSSTITKKYKKLFQSQIPHVILESIMQSDHLTCVVSDNIGGVSKGCEYLIKCGHEKIALLLEERHNTMMEERKIGYQKALENHGISYQDELVVRMPLEDEEETKSAITSIIKNVMPTAIVAAGNTLTFMCLKVIKELGLECPKDISVVGFGDDEWCELIEPPLSALTQNTEEIGKRAVELLLKKMEVDAIAPQIVRVPIKLTIRKSAQNLVKGPFGEPVVNPEQNFLTEEEIKDLKKESYLVGISFHYSGNLWTRLNEQAIKNTLSTFGVRVASVTDAHFDPELQNIQLEGLMKQHLDAIIAVPVDEIKTAEVFKKISSKTKLVLINNIPQGLDKEDYKCWISVNENENGKNAAKILGEHFGVRKKAKIGLLIHGASFLATKRRDFFAEQTLREYYPNLQIVAKRNFYTMDNTYDVCKRMVQDHPEIQGLYITWDRPALKAIAALEDMGRTDIAISTTDLDYEISSYIAKKKMIVGVSSQRPYDQGIAIANATGKVLLGKYENSCISNPPYTVTKNNLEKAWKDILKTKMPALGGE
ncbi:LacI family DNA-binding transcriptional regulator [Lachnospiraceae bacterium ZAX-1]